MIRLLKKLLFKFGQQSKKPEVVLLCFIMFALGALAQSPDANYPNRADWMRGTWGLNWKPGVGAGVVNEIEIDVFYS